MDKQAAANLIADTFDSAFTEDRFRLFIRNLIDEIAELRDSIWITGHIKASFKEHIKKYKRIGKYTDQDGNKLDVIIVHLRKEKALDRARTMQRNFVASYLKTRGEKDAAIVAYLTDNPEDWRFSFVRMEYKQDVTECGRVRVREELASARRYSFLVGKNEPNHTAQEQIIPLLQDDRNNPTIEELETAFSVETVTKRFYTDYRGLSEKLVEELDGIIEQDDKIKTEFETKSIDTPNFAKKLLGQIVFLYFVQKKGWLGVGKDDKGNFKHWGTGPKNFLRLLFKKKFIDYKNFFNEVLEPLFYIALATERENDYYDRLDCRTPFLNGGLFEPINGYNWQETDILISDDLLNEIFDTFDRYNFTVREDEPLEKEVAVDPEMLGKVFENLLPENLRKGKGTYYTPREIVHYMCQESLINYLDTAVNTGEVSLALTRATQEKLFGKPDPEQLSLKTEGYRSIIPRQDIEDFILKGEFAVEHDIAKEAGTKSYKFQVPASIRNNTQALDEKLSSIKVCDPAIGSGAFPVGMMHEIVKARNVLTTYLKNRTGRSIYDFKRHCIQESLYGVDIDPGAIDIAKLRLWLSLIVDEEDYHTIQPLPNLDYKIMQGNSLIEDFHGISLNIEKEKRDDMQLFNENKDLDKLIENLHSKQNTLFLSTHPEEKKQKKDEVENAVVEIFHYELQQNQVDYFKELTRIEDISKKIPAEKDRKKYYDKEKTKLDKSYSFDFIAVENELREMTRGNKVRNFFPWKLYFADVFRKNRGFDIVIANPPYVSHDKIVNKNYLKNRYGCYESFSDLYCYFIELATNLQNPSGILCYITSNSYLKAEYGFPLRRLVLKQNSLLQIINVEDYQVFDSAIVNSAVLISQNRTIGFHPDCIIVNSIYDGNKPFISFVDENKYFYKQNEFDVKSWSLANRNALFLKQKVEAVGPTLEELGTKIRLGIATGANYALIINEEIKTELICSDKHNKDIIKPILRGRDIFRYYYLEPNLYILLTKNGIDVKSEYPYIYDYLNTFSQKFKTRGAQGNHWSNLRACSFFSDFKKEKIIWIELTDKGRFALCDDEIYLLNTAYFLIPPPLISARYLLGILNSKLIQFYLSIIAGTSGMGTLRWINSYVKHFPIAQKQIDDQQALITIVDQILSLKESDPQSDTSALEAEIDRMVYELYALNEEKIAIVEESARR